jgi:hypothetical protein
MLNERITKELYQIQKTLSGAKRSSDSHSTPLLDYYSIAKLS